MFSETTRRAVLGALLAAGAGATAHPAARDLLDRFAPPSGRTWDAAGRELTKRVESPHGPATVRRDDDGVAHVEATRGPAAWFAVGYLHGFDRGFQLDLQRRLMRGQLSEVVGEATLSSDEFHVAMDFAGAADVTWEAVDDDAPETAAMVEAYVDGVNAAFESEALPLPFELLGYEPDPWTPADTMLMEKLISWNLTGSFRALRRRVAADALGEDVAANLYPARLDHDSPILRGEAGGTDDARIDDANTDVAANVAADVAADGDFASWLSRFDRDPGIGSNSWVVSGEYTDSGAPVVCNDPHLTLQAPPVWYEQHVETGSLNVRGVTFPGVPFVVIGENDASAWGFTNVGADVMDLYTYDVDDAGERYRYDGEWREFDVEERTIEVSGGDDRTMAVKKTVHGPLVEREGRRVGVAWTGHTATKTTVSVHALNRNRGLDDALAALPDFDLPTQNIVYADADGRTLYYVTGKIPRRLTDGEAVRGDRIFDGSAGEGEWPGFTPFGRSSWEGFVPFEEKPGVVDPDYVATANQRVEDDPEHYLAEAYAEPYRGARIYEMLDARAESGRPMDPDFHRRVQRDTYDGRVDDFRPALLDALDGTDLRDVRRTLADWGGRMDRDSRAALVFARFLHHFRARTFDPVFKSAGLDDSFHPSDWVLARLGEESAFYGDDRSRAETMVRAVRDALSELDNEGWEVYGDYNTTRALTHALGSQVPFLNYPERPTDGSPATVNNYRVESSAGSSWRMVCPMDGESECIVPGGNSGDYFSDHYADQLGRWADGEYKPMSLGRNGDVVVRFEEGDDE